LLEIINGLRTTNIELDSLMSQVLSAETSGNLDRDWFVALPHGVARETMAVWLRNNGRSEFDSKTLERLVVAAKTAKPGRVFDVSDGATLEVKAHGLALTVPER